MLLRFPPHMYGLMTAVFLLLALPGVGADETRLPVAYSGTTIHGDGSAGPYPLGTSFIGGTATVDSTAFSHRIQDWNSAAGTVTFDRILSAGDSVVVAYKKPPSWLRPSYRRPGDSGLHPVSPPGYRTEESAVPRSFQGLTFGGSKTFDISTGSGREVALNQALRLNISGNLTDDISLTAAVSDQNVPITPEGDTRQLQELDRVLIRVRGPRFSIDMGDTDLGYDSGRWLRWDRRLSGAYGSVRAGNADIFGSAAVSEGRFISTVLSPVEGNQGPYRLRDHQGSTDISVVPGTERIWINGDRLVRGIREDYTIDYDTGEVTFTENRIIGSDMRIVTDYEYTSESYRRTFYSGGAGGRFAGGKVRISMAGAREADDIGRPVLTDLTDSMKKLLGDAGDGDAFTSGIRPAADDTSGTYDMVDGHLVFNRGGGGAYNATFSWVGEGEGSYRYRGGGIYEFVPPEERGADASYEPVARIPAPVAHAVAGVIASFRPYNALTAEAEITGSSLDRNTLSPLDDGDNDGGAYRFGFSAEPSFSAGGIPLSLSLDGTHRRQGETFAALDRDRDAEENRRWGLPLAAQPGKETATEFSSALRAKTDVYSGSLAFEGGSLQLPAGADVSRRGGRLAFDYRDTVSSLVRGELIDRVGVTGLADERISRLWSSFTGSRAGFTSSFDYEHERVTGTDGYDHGSSFDELAASVKNPAVIGVTTSLDWLYRLERAKGIGWRDSSTVRGGGIQFEGGNRGDSSFRLRYARRERTGETGDYTSDQALFEGYYRPESGAPDVDFTYRAGSTREAAVRKNYIYVGDNRGSYRWEDYNGDNIRDTDEFVPDDHGGYYLYEERLGDYRPVNMVQVYGRINAEIPGHITRLFTSFDAPVSTETSLEINEKSTADARDVFLLNLSSFRTPGLTTSGDIRFQEDVTAPLGAGSLRLRHFRYAQYAAEYVTGGERTGQEETSARIRYPLSDDLDLESTLTYGSSSRTMDERPEGDYEVRSFSGETGVSFYPADRLRIGLDGGYGSDTDRVSDIDARYVNGTPSAAYFFPGKGSVEASYMLTSVTIDRTGGFRRLPYTMAQGKKEGDNHDITVTANYRLSRHMNLVVTYNGRRFAGDDFEQYARAQMRAIF